MPGKKVSYCYLRMHSNPFCLAKIVCKAIAALLEFGLLFNTCKIAWYLSQIINCWFILKVEVEAPPYLFYIFEIYFNGKNFQNCFKNFITKENVFFLLTLAHPGLFLVFYCHCKFHNRDWNIFASFLVHVVLVSSFFIQFLCFLKLTWCLHSHGWFNVTVINWTG